MYYDTLFTDLKKAVIDLGFICPSDALLSISENVLFGDYSSNIALQLSKQKHQNSYQNPREIANDIIEKLGHPAYLERVDIAGAGFINFYLKDIEIAKNIEVPEEKPIDLNFQERVLVEYASPNAFKPLHIGHLRNIITGESIARMLIFQGKDIFKVTYTSDIGPAVAKAIWGVIQLKDKFEAIDKDSSLDEKARFLGEAYVLGNEKFESDPEVKEQIDQINIKLYQNDPKLIEIWKKTRTWSEGYLSAVYSRLGTEFDAEIWESEMGERGMEIARDHLDRVFIEDQGAIIFPGEKYGLHNRVFITGKGTPTYEAKELAVTEKERELFPYDRAIHVVSHEQSEYFKVVTKAIELIDTQMIGKKIHLGYGFVSLTSGKMSSRLGNVIIADDLIDQVKAKITEIYPRTNSERNLELISLAAIKFAYLKYSLNSEIAFNVEQSVALQGDTGPYVLYVYARIHSLLDRAKVPEVEKEIEEAEDEEIAQEDGSDQMKSDKSDSDLIRFDPILSGPLEAEERELLRQMEYFEPIVNMAAKDFQPSLITNYLLSLAKAFNQFYEKCPILGGKKTEFRLALAKRVGERIKLGLYLLGIETVEKM
jgi:arginyl-tRNA synthetase